MYDTKLVLISRKQVLYLKIFYIVMNMYRYIYTVGIMKNINV